MLQPCLRFFLAPIPPSFGLFTVPGPPLARSPFLLLYVQVTLTSLPRGGGTRRHEASPAQPSPRKDQRHQTVLSTQNNPSIAPQKQNTPRRCSITPFFQPQPQPRTRARTAQNRQTRRTLSTPPGGLPTRDETTKRLDQKDSQAWTHDVPSHKKRNTKSGFFPRVCWHSLRTSPPARDVDPLGEARALLALDVDDVRVAAAPAAHAVLLGVVPPVPVLVLLEPLALVQGRLLQVRLPRQLQRRRVRGTVLDRRVPVPEVAEVVDVLRPQQDARRERVNGRVAPLFFGLACCGLLCDE